MVQNIYWTFIFSKPAKNWANIVYKVKNHAEHESVLHFFWKCEFAHYLQRLRWVVLHVFCANSHCWTAKIDGFQNQAFLCFDHEIWCLRHDSETKSFHLTKKYIFWALNANTLMYYCMGSHHTNMWFRVSWRVSEVWDHSQWDNCRTYALQTTLHHQSTEKYLIASGEKIRRLVTKP